VYLTTKAEDRLIPRKAKPLLLSRGETALTVPNVSDFSDGILTPNELVGALHGGVREQASQIKKVSAELEPAKPAVRTVLNDQ
jgi:hypothetical protein